MLTINANTASAASTASWPLPGKPYMNYPGNGRAEQVRRGWHTQPPGHTVQHPASGEGAGAPRRAHPTRTCRRNPTHLQQPMTPGGCQEAVNITPFVVITRMRMTVARRGALTCCECTGCTSRDSVRLELGIAAAAGEETHVVLPHGTCQWPVAMYAYSVLMSSNHRSSCDMKGQDVQEMRGNQRW